MTEENKENQKPNVDLDQELAKLREEMKEIKEILSSNKSETDDDTFVPPRPPRKPKSPKINIKFDEGDFDIEDFDDLGHNLNEYMQSVMSGVSENLRSSMAQMARGFRFVDAFDEEFRDAKRAKREVEREMRRMKKNISKEARRAARLTKDKHHNEFVFHFKPMVEEELELFFEKTPDLMSGLSDKRRLQILKELEKGPKYQGDLSEVTDMKGGTFKHHMDTLLHAKFVYQEATRGRYLITQLGMEALKLSEMVFRRYFFEEKKASGETGSWEIDTEFEDDSGVDIEIEDEETNADESMLDEDDLNDREEIL